MKMLQEILSISYYGNSLAMWALAFSGVLVSIFVSRRICRILKNNIVKLTKRTKTTLDDALVGSLERPISFFLIVVGVWFAINTFLVLPEAPHLRLETFYSFVVIFCIAWIIARTGDVLLENYLITLREKETGKSGFGGFLLPLLRTTFHFILWTVALMIGLDNAGYKIGAILAGLGVGGIAVAMAAKDIVSDLLGSAHVVFTRPFRVGDMIDYGGRWATVLEFTARRTTLRCFSTNHLIVVPNSYFITNDIVNVSDHPGHMILMNLRLSLKNTAEKVELALQKIEEIIRNIPGTRFIWIKFDHFDDYSFVLRMHYDILEFRERNRIKSAINLEILQELQGNGIELASFPVDHRSDEGPEMGRPAGDRIR